MQHNAAQHSSTAVSAVVLDVFLLRVCCCNVFAAAVLLMSSPALLLCRNIGVTCISRPLPPCFAASVLVLTVADTTLPTRPAIAASSLPGGSQSSHLAALLSGLLLPLVVLPAAGLVGRALWRRQQQRQQQQQSQRFAAGAAENDSLLLQQQPNGPLLSSSAGDAGARPALEGQRTRLLRLLRAAGRGQGSLEMVPVRQVAGSLAHNIASRTAPVSISWLEAAAAEAERAQAAYAAGAGQPPASLKWGLETESMRLQAGELEVRARQLSRPVL